MRGTASTDTRRWRSTPRSRRLTHGLERADYDEQEVPNNMQNLMVCILHVQVFAWYKLVIKAVLMSVFIVVLDLNIM